MKTIKDYDEKGNVIHFKNSNGYEYWKDYDEKGNVIHFKNSAGYECSSKYNDKGNEIYFKNSDGYEYNLKNRDMITIKGINENYSEVYLEKKKVGRIVRVAGGFQYKPYGSKSFGEVMATKNQVIESLKN